VDFDGLRAKLAHGLLQIMVPKKEENQESERRRIEMED
jgi:HSP20 family molecular chaperone IbpA